jgi:hypothetical protein
MRWVGLIFSAAILATAVWFAFAAPYQSGDALVLAANTMIGSAAA